MMPDSGRVTKEVVTTRVGVSDAVDRGEVRDDFDLMSIGTDRSLLVETGLAFLIGRYSPSLPDHCVDSIVRTLGYFGHAADGPKLPGARAETEEYRMRRQRPLMKHIAMFGD